jgi:hypothetical protein
MRLAVPARKLPSAALIRSSQLMRVPIGKFCKAGADS